MTNASLTNQIFINEAQCFKIPIIDFCIRHNPSRKACDTSKNIALLNIQKQHPHFFMDTGMQHSYSTIKEENMSQSKMYPLKIKESVGQLWDDISFDDLCDFEQYSTASWDRWNYL